MDAVLVLQYDWVFDRLLRFGCQVFRPEMCSLTGLWHFQVMCFAYQIFCVFES